MARIRILSPVGVVATDRLTGGIGELLRGRHGVKTIVHRRKANAATAAPPELIAEMGKLCDVVFAGSAD